MYEPILEALRRNAVDEALALARDWVARAPESAQAQRALAQVLAQSGDPAAALVALEQALALAPEDAGLHFERAGLLLRARDPGAAGTALDESAALDPNHFATWVARAELALARGDLDEAAQLIRTAGRLQPDHARLDVLSALLALRQGDADRALALASAATSRLPDDPQLLSVLGFAYLGKRHWAFAEQAFTRLATLLPDDRPLRPIRARLAATQGRAGEALDLLAPVLADPAGATPALRRVAGLYALQAGRADEARVHLCHVLQAGAADRAVLQGLMSLWRASGDHEDARATLDAALAAHAGNPDLWAARLALETPGDEAGGAVLERWLAAMPGHVPALEVALLASDRAGDAAATERFAKRLIERDPTHLVATRFQVESQLTQDPEAALERARALLASRTDESERIGVGAWLGRLLDRAGRPREALAQWQALHDAVRAQRVPLPQWTPAPSAWPVLATPVPGAARPLLVWGLPGAGIERVVDTLAAAGGPLRGDRFGATPPQDPLQSPLAARALVDGSLDPAVLVARWRAALPARGIADGQVIDWLPWWDNALLLALRPHLPEGLLLGAVRDPRDMLLDWLADGFAVPLVLEDADSAAEWLAQGLEQLATLHEQDLYPHLLLRLDAVLDSPPALAAAVGQALGLALPPPPVAPRRLPAGRWRDYAEVLAGPFARLAPVAARLGYPEA